VPPKKEGAAEMNGPAMKLFTTMGLRICELENLVVKAAGGDCWQELANEALRILGKKKEGGFDDAWRTLADLGQCDTIGGMEYQRVLGEWRGYKGSDSMENFIKRRANIGPFEKKEGVL
jgi:hypothetical protein